MNDNEQDAVDTWNQEHPDNLVVTAHLSGDGPYAVAHLVLTNGDAVQVPFINYNAKARFDGLNGLGADEPITDRDIAAAELGADPHVYANMLRDLKARQERKGGDS